MEKILVNAELTFGLSIDQVEILRPKLASLLQEYEKDLVQFLNQRWFFETTYSFVVIAALPDSDIEKIFTESQFKRWKNTFKTDWMTSGKRSKSCKKIGTKRSEIGSRALKIRGGVILATC